MENDPVVLLCKFGEQQFMNDVLHGRLFMRPLAAFLSEENNAARRDIREGYSYVMQGDKFTLEMEMDGEFKSIGGLLNLAHRPPDSFAPNVFCMYAVRASQVYKPFEQRIREFGDTFVLIRDGDAFLKRVRAAAENTGHTVQWSLVQYFDWETYSGPVGIFRKSSDFSYQSEFRIALLPGTRSPYVLNVGDLTDIAISGALTEVTEE